MPAALRTKVVACGPLVIERSASENMIDRFPRGKVGGQVPPGDAPFDHIEDGVQDAPQIDAWPTAFGRFGEHGVEILPLRLGEAGFVAGVFHV